MREMWEEVQGAVVVVSGRRLAYLRLSGGVLAWRKDDTVYAGWIPEYLPLPEEIRVICDLCWEVSDEDPRDFGDRCFPVAPEERAAWLAGHREGLIALIEEAKKTDAARRETEEWITKKRAVLAALGVEE